MQFGPELFLANTSSRVLRVKNFQFDPLCDLHPSSYSIPTKSKSRSRVKRCELCRVASDPTYFKRKCDMLSALCGTIFHSESL
jgi:hypothetical protein